MLSAVYQKRNFMVSDGQIRYESGKGETQTVEVMSARRCLPTLSLPPRARLRAS